MHESAFTRDAAVARFHAHSRPRPDWRVGIEYETHLLDASGRPMPYAGPDGVAGLLERLAVSGGWARVHEGDHLIALQRGRCSITLEPGNQLEFGGSPCRTLAEVGDEVAGWCGEVETCLDGTGFRQHALGLTPMASVDEIVQNPKARYRVMADQLPRVGPRALHMMRATAAVQANFDWSDEADCAAKVRLGTALGPLTTAMFAHSPIELGAPTGLMSTRGHIWTLTDPSRTGLPEAASSFTFERWVDWLLDVPVLFRRDADGRWQAGEGTFRSWAASRTPPTWSDWDLHVTSVFPEVRVKRTIEIRGADCVPVPLAVAFCALWRTLLYEQRAMDRATALSVEFCRHGTPEERFRTAVQSGLRGMVGGRSLASWAEDLVDAAEAGVPATRPDDLRYLQPLARQVERGESPARSLVRALRREGGDARAVLALARTEAERVTMPEAGAALAPSPLRTGLKGARAIDRISVLARTALPRIEGPEADETRVTLRKLLERLDAALATGLHTGLPTERWSQLRTALQPLEDALDQVNDDEPPDWNRVSTVARSALSSLRN